MTARAIVGGLVLVCVTALVTRQVVSDDKAGGEKPKIPDAGSEMAKMMEAYKRANEIGRHHRLLEPIIGRWDVSARFYMSPNEPPAVDKATFDRKWILGGRYYMEEYKGRWMGEPFEGVGLGGYDNHKRRYITVWADSMSTAFFTEEGEVDAAGKVFTHSGTMDDPVLKVTKKIRSVIRVESNDKHTLEMYETGPDGQEQKTMELVCTRR